MVPLEQPKTCASIHDLKEQYMAAAIKRNYIELYSTVSNYSLWLALLTQQAWEQLLRDSPWPVSWVTVHHQNPLQH